MKISAPVLLVSFAVVSARDGENQLFNFFKKVMTTGGPEAGDNTILDDIREIVGPIRKIMTNCYDTSIMLEAVKQCGRGEGTITSLNLQSLLVGDSTKETLAEIRDVVKARMGKIDQLCVARFIGIISEEGELTQSGIERYIRTIVIKESLEVEAIKESRDCFKITQGCVFKEKVKEQAKLYMSCLKPKMLKMCMGSVLAEKLGGDVDFDLGF